MPFPERQQEDERTPPAPAPPLWFCGLGWGLDGQDPGLVAGGRLVGDRQRREGHQGLGSRKGLVRVPRRRGGFVEIAEIRLAESCWREGWKHNQHSAS